MLIPQQANTVPELADIFETRETVLDIGRVPETETSPKSVAKRIHSAEKCDRMPRVREAITSRRLGQPYTLCFFHAAVILHHTAAILLNAILLNMA